MKKKDNLTFVDETGTTDTTTICQTLKEKTTTNTVSGNKKINPFARNRNFRKKTASTSLETQINEMTTQSKRTQSQSSVKTVRVKFDVGYDNQIYVRGQGGGLSWSKGIALQNSSFDEWIWSVSSPADVKEFKFLVNDEYYETGSNRTLPSEDNVTIFPKFN